MIRHYKRTDQIAKSAFDCRHSCRQKSRSNKFLRHFESFVGSAQRLPAAPRTKIFLIPLSNVALLLWAWKQIYFSWKYFSPFTRISTINALRVNFDFCRFQFQTNARFSFGCMNIYIFI